MSGNSNKTETNQKKSRRIPSDVTPQSTLKWIIEETTDPKYQNDPNKKNNNNNDKEEKKDDTPVQKLSELPPQEREEIKKLFLGQIDNEGNPVTDLNSRSQLVQVIQLAMKEVFGFDKLANINDQKKKNVQSKFLMSYLIFLSKLYVKNVIWMFFMFAFK